MSIKQYANDVDNLKIEMLLGTTLEDGEDTVEIDKLTVSDGLACHHWLLAIAALDTAYNHLRLCDKLFKKE